MGTIIIIVYIPLLSNGTATRTESETTALRTILKNATACRVAIRLKTDST